MLGSDSPEAAWPGSPKNRPTLLPNAVRPGSPAQWHLADAHVETTPLTPRTDREGNTPHWRTLLSPFVPASWSTYDLVRDS